MTENPDQEDIVLPQTMRAVGPMSGGGPDVLEIQSRPVPQPGDDQVLIAVAFAGVNRHDCNQRTRGTPPKGATDILGLEVSGRVVAAGRSVRGLAPGDQVCALINGGGYAEYALADAQLTFPLPGPLDLERSASVPEALFTSWLNLVWLCDLKAGHRVLIHGGASGVGLIATQLATALGATVFTTAGSAEKCAFSMQHGAQRSFNYRSDDFVAGVAEETGGAGVDAILDMAGGLYAERNLHALARDGHITHLSSGIEPTYSIPLSLMMQKRARITGAQLRSLPNESKRQIARELLENVWPMLGDEIRPVVEQVLPLEKAAAAHTRMESGDNLGKLLLQP